MRSIELKAAKREKFGNKASRRIRKQGQVPCALYGGGDTVHFLVDAVGVRKLIYTPHSYIVELNIDGKKELAVMREIQFHSVRDQILHMDFYRVIPGQPVEIDIPINITGNSEGVRQGGTLYIDKRKIRVRGMMEVLPDELKLDVTTLGLNGTIFAEDLNFEGLELITPPDTAVCSVRMTRMAAALSSTEEDVDEEEQEGTEEVEGGEGEGAEESPAE